MADAAGTTLTWSVSGGDSGDFSIDAGVLGFVTSPDYEAPADAGADNRYPLNGNAKEYFGIAGGTVEIRSIWRGSQLDLNRVVSDMIQRGLALC